jgi:predicted nucleotidyltransferase
MIPDLHQKFIDKAVAYFSKDSRFDGIAAGGSYITGEMDDFSDIDFIIVIKPEHYQEVMNERKLMASDLGNLLSAFTGEHVGEPRLLICLYGPPLLHVDLKFVSLDDFPHRVEDPVILWERDEELSKRMTEEEAVFPYPDLQWIEDRFWVWIHYAGTKLGRNEIFETIEFISFLRQSVIGPLVLMKNHKLPRGVRKIEVDAPEESSRLRQTIVEYNKQSCIRSLEALTALYLELREKFATDAFEKKDEAQKYAVDYLMSLKE